MIITLTLITLTVVAAFFQLGLVIGRQQQKKLDTERLGRVTLNFGGIYKVIDEYREMLAFFKAHCTGAEEAVQGAFWIRRIIAQHDQMLHQLLPLIDKTSRDKTRTGTVRKLPFCEVEWEGLTEVIRRGGEERLSKIIEKASNDCWSPILSEEDIFRAVQLSKTNKKCNCCARGGEYNGFGSDGPLLFVCDIPNGCACHD